MALTSEKTCNARRERLRALLAQLERAPLGGRRDELRQQAQILIADIRQICAALDVARQSLTTSGARDGASSVR